MNKKNDFKINVISGIDEDVINRVTETRCILIEKRRASVYELKRRRISVIAIAAAVAVLLSLLAVIIIPLMKPDGKVPIYTGMTVSSADGENVSVNIEPLLSNDITLLSTTGVRQNVMMAEKLYYVEQNEDIFITVHFDNPDNFKIMSFTLNGEPYADYMFEYGSDYENIIIKVNVGEALGIIDYTIDAIQYADRDVLKYVEMQGDPTVSIGVYGDTMPVQSVSDENIGINDIELKINVEPTAFEDEKIEGLSIIIEDDEKIVAEKELKIGENTVKLEGLLTGTEYRYAIVMKLISQNGENKSYILAEKRFKTQEALTFELVSLTDEAVSFEIKWNEIFKGTKAFTSLTLYIGDVKVRDIDVDATTIDGLSPDTEYTIVAQYVNAVEESCEFIFKTKVKMVGYTVNHHIENINDTNYTLYETESLKESQNTEVTPDVKSYEGFNSPEKQTVTVKPDGSLVVDYYYTRKSYKLIFFSNGGDDIPVQELKYGSDINIQNIKREGYTFGGWFTDGTLTKAFTEGKIGASDLKLYAWWKEETKPSSFSFSLTGEYATVIKFTGSELSVVIPEYIAGKRVTVIGGSAFEKSVIMSVVIPDSVERIEAKAFVFCDYLKRVTMGKGLRYIGVAAFLGCNNICEIYIDDLEAWFNVELKDPINPNSVSGYSIYIKGELLTDLVVPETVTAIGDYLFTNCKKIRTIKFHNRITSIGNDTFYNLDALTELNIPDSVKSIGDYAFCSCDNITDLIIPNSVTSIGKGAFMHCRNLLSVTIPDSVKTIESRAFESCDKLEFIKIGKGVTFIGERAFSIYLLKNIYYAGTKEEWNKITKSLKWDADVYYEHTIHCSDGKIVMPKTLG